MSDFKIADFRSFGLKVGLEFHQRLAGNKLFCSCPSDFRDEKPLMVVERRLRPSAGELGQVDPAAMHEFVKSLGFKYETVENSCLVELDEEPPHEVNNEALEAALQIALLLNCNVNDEVHVMRKIVVDG